MTNNLLDRLEASAEIVLGAILHDSDTHLETVRKSCPTAAIWPPVLDRAYSAVLKLADRNAPISAETVGNESDISVEKLLRWQAIGTTVSQPEVDANVAIMIERGKLWHQQRVGRHLADGKITGSEAARRLREIEEYAHEDYDPTADALGLAFLEEVSRPVTTGAVLGFGLMDVWTWGWQPSKTTLLSAPYKGRKTTMLRNIILAAASRGQAVSVALAEGRVEDMAAGCVAMIARQILDTTIGSEAIARMGGAYLKYTRDWKRNKAEYDAVMQAVALWRRLPITLYDTRHGAKDPATMFARWRRADRLDLVAVDYAQILDAPGKTIYDRMVYVAGWAGDVTAQLGVHLLLASQLNEDEIKRGSGYSPGVKGGGDLPAQADTILRLVYNNEDSPRTLKAQTKHAREAGNGVERFTLDPASGLIRAVGDAPYRLLPADYLAPQQDSLLEVA